MSPGALIRSAVYVVSAVHRSELERPPRLTVDSTLFGKYGCAPGATSSIKKRAEAERLRHGRRL